MKALIRDDETITEPFDKWIAEHLDWLTTARPDGDGYSLAEDAPADSIPADFDITEVQIPDTNAPAEEGAEAPTITRCVAIFSQARYEARKAQEVGEADPAPIEAPVAEEGASGGTPDTIIIDGVEYTRVVGE